MISERVFNQHLAKLLIVLLSANEVFMDIRSIISRLRPLICRLLILNIASLLAPLSAACSDCHTIVNLLTLNTLEKDY